MQEIRVEVHFTDTDPVPADQFRFALMHIEQAVYRVESDLLDDAIEHLGAQAKPLVVDAAKHRFRKAMGTAILIESSSPGLLIINGYVAALAYSMLEGAMGESYGEGWHESDTYRELKNFFGAMTNEIPSKIARAIKQRGSRASRRDSTLPESMTLIERPAFNASGRRYRIGLEVEQKSESKTVAIFVTTQDTTAQPTTYRPLLG